MWKPIGIIAVALLGGLWAERSGVGSLLLPVAVLQALGFLASLFIDERRSASLENGSVPPFVSSTSPRESLLTDRSLWLFVLAMVLFHAANAPGGVYLGLHLKRGLAAPDSWLAYAFVVSMLSWMLVVWPCGRLADRIGRKPLLVLAWSLMAVRLLFVALCQSPWQIVANQVFDGASNGLFSVVAATWVTDRLADPRRNGEAQAIVGTSLVLGSAIGPAVCALVVSEVGYRVLFAGLAGVGALATVLVLFVPETLNRPADSLVRKHETVPGV